MKTKLMVSMVFVLLFSFTKEGFGQVITLDLSNPAVPMVTTAKPGENSIDLYGLPAGNYLFRHGQRTAYITKQ
jgi:hypothetical protein